ncbi:CMRF35-like molecule 8 [Sinocyclocheilus anshuiensis]|uniref:CMRF35-like molecule 8 n=1 Tax=Sinocyclocheilus anshuiensis TaxID=1608454 RepID=UPI0007B98511|nr:PREDICTED: CMRF35-like molecule 8 [Sinocyclocheilus anshuiensis]
MIQIRDDKLLIFHLLLLVSVAVCETNEILTFTAHERGTVEIQCSYKSRYEEHVKYLCRGKCPRLNKDKAVESGSAARDKRFSLTDDKTAHNFTVTITDLRTEDQGQYWCGIETGLGKLDDFTEIHLEIKHVSRVSGVTGKHLYIPCNYESELKSDVKFICKGSDPSLCEKSAVRVSSESHSNGRFSLSDNEPAGVFTVTITDLTEEDSGIYWCGAAQGRQEHKNKWISVIDLNISAVSDTSESMSSKPTTTTASFHTSKPAPADTASSRPITSSSSSSSSPSTSPSVLMFFLSSPNAVSPKPQPGLAPIIMVMVIVIGILTGFGFSSFIYLRRRQKKEGTQPKDVVRGPTKNLPSGDMGETREADCDYEDISSTLDHPDYSLVLPAFAEHDASVYALAQLPSSPSDDLNYSSIKFTAAHHSDRTSDGQETCDYTTVRP